MKNMKGIFYLLSLILLVVTFGLCSFEVSTFILVILSPIATISYLWLPSITLMVAVILFLIGSFCFNGKKQLKKTIRIAIQNSCIAYMAVMILTWLVMLLYFMGTNDSTLLDNLSFVSLIVIMIFGFWFIISSVVLWLINRGRSVVSGRK